MRQDGVLLRLVEAMDLVDEEHRLDAGAPVDPGFGDHLAQVGNAGGHRRHGNHPGTRFGSEQSGEGGLAAPGRPPQDDAGQVAALRQAAQHVHHPLLADHVLERLGTQPRRQWGQRLGTRRGREELPLICQFVSNSEPGGFSGASNRRKRDA